jgi:hypothetical protein
LAYRVTSVNYQRPRDHPAICRAGDVLDLRVAPVRVFSRDQPGIEQRTNHFSTKMGCLPPCARSRAHPLANLRVRGSPVRALSWSWLSKSRRSDARNRARRLHENAKQFLPLQSVKPVAGAHDRSGQQSFSSSAVASIVQVLKNRRRQGVNQMVSVQPETRSRSSGSR